MDAELSNRSLSEQATFVLLSRHFLHMLPPSREMNMPVFDGNYDFAHAGLSDLSYQQLPDVLVHSEYKEIAAPFRASLDRLMSFFELPLQLIFWSGRLAQVKFIARYRCGVDPQDASKDEESQVNETMQRVFEEMVTDKGTSAVSMSSRVLGSMVGDHTMSGIGPAREGVEAVLAAMVMAIYATFETLAADLWIAAVNRHHVLARNWIEKNPEKQLSATVIAGYGFDVSGRMGTLLHDTKKVSFESLFDIKKLYTDAFKGEIDDAFEPVNDLLKAEKTRHLFAHRGGLIDQKFKDQMKGHPEYASALVGERLRLTGPVTGSHVSACTKSGIALLKAVDKWSLSQI
jgi:hypothetical protein